MLYQELNPMIHIYCILWMGIFYQELNPMINIYCILGMDLLFTMIESNYPLFLLGMGMWYQELNPMIHIFYILVMGMLYLESIQCSIFMKFYGWACNIRNWIHWSMIIIF